MYLLFQSLKTKAEVVIYTCKVLLNRPQNSNHSATLRSTVHTTNNSHLFPYLVCYFRGVATGDTWSKGLNRLCVTTRSSMGASLIVGALTRKSLSAPSQVDSSSSCCPGYTHKTGNCLCKVISAHCLEIETKLVKLHNPTREIPFTSLTTLELANAQKFWLNHSHSMGKKPHI